HQGAVPGLERPTRDVVERETDEERRAADDGLPARAGSGVQVDVDAAAVARGAEEAEQQQPDDRDEQQPTLLRGAAGEVAHRVAPRHTGEDRLTPRRAGMRALEKEGREPRR